MQLIFSPSVTLYKAETKVRPLPCLVFSCFARCSRLPPEALCPAPAQPSSGHARVHVPIVPSVRVELGPCQIAIRAQTPADDEALAGAGLYIQTLLHPIIQVLAGVLQSGVLPVISTPRLMELETTAGSDDLSPS